MMCMEGVRTNFFSLVSHLQGRGTACLPEIGETEIHHTIHTPYHNQHPAKVSWNHSKSPTFISHSQSGFNTSVPTVWILEGLVYYLKVVCGDV